jgi:LCP family protein required for cell wall assembly
VSTTGQRGYVAKHSRRRGRSAARRLLIGVNVVVALSIVAGGLTIGYTEYRLHQIKRVHINDVVAAGKTKQSHVVKGQPASAGPPETFLIVGSDTRAGLDQSGDSAYGSAAAVGGARSDTIILARVVPATKQIALLSIPRDTYLDIPGLGMSKINAALGVSPNLLVQVIESTYGIDINHYVDVDFDSFKDIADALGGVEVYFPTKVRDVNAGLYINAPGCVNLTGSLALAFVRSREYTWDDDGVWVQEGESDLARIQRQQIFIRLLAAKAQSEGLGDPLTLNGIISGLTKNLTVDDTLSNKDLITLASTFRHVDAANITGWTMPTYASTVPTSEGPEDILVPEKAEDQAMVAQFLAFGLTPAATPTTTVASPTTGRSTTSASGRSTTSTTNRAVTTTTSSTVPASSVEVTVENGSGLTGQAGTTASGLEAAGFDVVGTETASSFGRTASVVEYGAGEEAAADTVAAHLEGRVTTEEVAGLGSGVVLYTGSLLTGVRTTVSSTSGTTPGSSGGLTPASATTVPVTTTSPAATTTTVPATTTTTYVLPGTPATGAPSCP